MKNHLCCESQSSFSWQVAMQRPGRTQILLPFSSLHTDWIPPIVLQSRLLPHCSVGLKNVGWQAFWPDWDCRQTSPLSHWLLSLQVFIGLHLCSASHTSLLEQSARHSSGWTQLLILPFSLQTFLTFWVFSQSLFVTHWCNMRSDEPLSLAGRHVPFPIPGPNWPFLPPWAHQQNSPALQSLLDLHGWATTHFCFESQISFPEHWDRHCSGRTQILLPESSLQTVWFLAFFTQSSVVEHSSIFAVSSVICWHDFDPVLPKLTQVWLQKQSLFEVQGGAPMHLWSESQASDFKQVERQSFWLTQVRFPSSSSLQTLFSLSLQSALLPHSFKSLHFFSLSVNWFVAQIFVLFTSVQILTSTSTSLQDFAFSRCSQSLLHEQVTEEKKIFLNVKIHSDHLLMRQGYIHPKILFR